ncbi:hypothetical protein [Flavobacterium sp. ZT3R18]|uniref:hypothetical protein n=1 Tax=Flavobacterium sp. ZT3R18 TaxID=2594429 RepID=UPI00163DA082|nr:hypothetical protein [Flavobacterium sp. ZT3R18]
MKIIEYQNIIVTDEINTNEDLAIPPDSYRDPTKTILSTYEIKDPFLLSHYSIFRIVFYLLSMGYWGQQNGNITHF